MAGSQTAAADGGNHLEHSSPDRAGNANVRGFGYVLQDTLQKVVLSEL